MQRSDMCIRTHEVTIWHLSKSIFAPEDIATYVHPSVLFSLMYFTIPAIAKAPAGSSTHLVSLNPILIAAHISSAVNIDVHSVSFIHRSI